MSGKSAIEWTENTWNPVTGCSKVSPGCAHCYAESYTERMAGQRGWPAVFKPWTPENAAENVILHPERLRAPFAWEEPAMVFVNSMSDLFHELVPFEFVDRVYDVMSECPHLIFQVLTKRPERMRLYSRGNQAMRGNIWSEWPLPNVWHGTSIENDRWVGRADELRGVMSDIRFLSLEPLIGPLPSLDLAGIDWVIVGGESGVDHRPIDPDWVRDLRDRSVAAGVAFFFKQWGGRTPKSGGRVLDGRTWDEFPVRARVAA